MTKISIIMPVYNCKAFLRESINSVLQQSIGAWELLCVDDGSVDGSLEILHEYARKDARIKVYTQENQGAGVARNKGLQIAKGEFAAFLDGDDYYLDADALETMYNTCILRGVEACGTNLRILRNGKVVQDTLFSELQKDANDGRVCRYRDFQFDYGYYCFIYKLEVLRREKIIFPPYRRYQDPPFFVKAMYAIDKFCFVDKALYCYRAPNAVMRFSDEKLEGLISGIYDNLEFARTYELNQLFHKTVKRLEWEYGAVICHNISEKSVSVLKLLLKANDLIQEVYGHDYTIRPLREILGSTAEAERGRKKAFIDKLRQKERVYVYGAGKMTKDFLECLRENRLFDKVEGILVTDKENNPDMVEGVAVEAIDFYNYQNGDIVVIAVSGIYQEEIIGKLQEKGVYSYSPIDVGMFSDADFH